MSKSITANVPSRKVSWGGKTKVYAAYTMTFVQDDDGRWTSEDVGAMTEAEVIDVCRKATDWPQIRAQHFPMHGFHA